jgi:subtilisin family serine protease
MARRWTKRHRATVRLCLALGVVCSPARPALAVDLSELLLPEAAVAKAHGTNAKTRGGPLSLARRQSHLRSLDRKHETLSAAARGMGGEELGRVSRAHNAVALRIDARRVVDLANLPGVVAVRPVRTYELALSDTVAYIGAAAARTAGKDGTGARVAVLDSGIDYTHKNLGGPGTTAAYETAVTTFPNPYFPSAKVVGGFDFVGSKWPGTPGRASTARASASLRERCSTPSRCAAR